MPRYSDSPDREQDRRRGEYGDTRERSDGQDRGDQGRYRTDRDQSRYPDSNAGGGRGVGNYGDADQRREDQTGYSSSGGQYGYDSQRGDGGRYDSGNSGYDRYTSEDEWRNHENRKPQGRQDDTYGAERNPYQQTRHQGGTDRGNDWGSDWGSGNRDRDNKVGNTGDNSGYRTYGRGYSGDKSGERGQGRSAEAQPNGGAGRRDWSGSREDGDDDDHRRNGRYPR